MPTPRRKVVRKKATRKKTVRKKAISKPTTMPLTTQITKTVTIEAPVFPIGTRRGRPRDTLISCLFEGNSPSTYRYAEAHTVRFVSHNKALHLDAGCRSVYRFMDRATTVRFIKWAIKSLAIKPSEIS